MRHLFMCSVCLLLFNCNEKHPEKVTDKVEDSSSEIKYDQGAVLPFAPQVFSQFSNVRDFTISADETEAYFTLLSPLGELSVIMKIQKENNTWNTPEIASFSGRYTDLEPFLSPDGLKLYFASNRPVSKDSTSVKDFDIWYVERDQTDLEWSQPVNLGAPVNSDLDEFYPSVATSNNIYFTAVKKELESQDDIFMSAWDNGTYSEPVLLGDGVNTKCAEYNAFIAPDESYLIFGGWRRSDGLGSGDLYMSKRMNGVWQDATNLGPDINSEYMEYCPFVNTETGTLYITSRRSRIEKKESGFTSFDELMAEINRYDNGSSRIYKVDFNDLVPQ